MRRRDNLSCMQKALVSWALIGLALSPATPALAATGTGTSTTGSILITQAISHPAYAYQVFDGDVEDDGSVADIRWGTGVDGTALLAELTSTSGFAGVTSARAVAEKLNVVRYNPETKKWEPVTSPTITESGSGSKDTALAKTFAEIVSRHLKAEGAIAFDDTDTPLASNLDDGWYVVVSDYGTNLAEGASLLFPGLITVGKEQSRVTPKESAPTLEKEVKEDSAGWQTYADFEIGQTFQQRLTATIGDADLSYYHSYYLGFTDTLSSGLDLDRSSVKVTIDDADKTSLFTIGYANRVLTVEASDILSAIHAGSKVVVTYNTTLNANATIGGAGNTNSAVLSYSADPRLVQNGSPEIKNVTPGEETTSYTYELKLTKTDSADDTLKLAGAKFSLRRASDNKYAILSVYGGTAVDSATNNNTGNPRVVVTGWADTQQAGGLVTTDADGCANIVGLDATDAYILNEVVAPDGYDLDKRDIPFTISADSAENVAFSNISISVSGGPATNGVVETGLVSMGATNVKAPVLPTTGLGGIVASVVLGSGLVAAAATVIVRQTSRRRWE